MAIGFLHEGEVEKVILGEVFLILMLPIFIFKAF